MGRDWGVWDGVYVNHGMGCAVLAARDIHTKKDLARNRNRNRSSSSVSWGSSIARWETASMLRSGGERAREGFTLNQIRAVLARGVLAYFIHAPIYLVSSWLKTTNESNPRIYSNWHQV